MRSRGRLGFTLIELLVVIAIIALLIGILLPSLGSARDTAKAVKCGGQLQQMAVGSTGYVQDNGGYWLGGHRQLPSPYIYSWFIQLRQYVGEQNAIYNCPVVPEDFHWKKQYDPSNFLWSNQLLRRQAETLGYEEFEVPLRGNMNFQHFGYGYNEWGVGSLTPPGSKWTLGMGGHPWLDGFYNEPVTYRKHSGISESRIVMPTKMIVIADGAITGRDDAFIHPNLRYYLDDPTNLNNANPSARHMGRTEVMWADGHVSMELTDQLVAKTPRDRRKWNWDHTDHLNEQQDPGY